MAVSMASGPADGLAILDRLADEPTLRDYPYYFSARGNLLARLGRPEEAAPAFLRAAELTRNARERAWLLERAREGEADPQARGASDAP
jgi:predicted RNA polymerase sigma factor